MTTTFENAKIGDKVYDYYYDQYGRVIEIGEYSITVQLALNSGKFVYDKNGRVSNTRILFWDKPEIIAPEQPPRMKLIHGVEVPDISFKPTIEDRFYYPVLGYELYKTSTYLSYGVDKFKSEHNLCYPYTEEGKQAAILHAKAMLGIKG